MERDTKINFTIKEQVYSILKGKILDGTFCPGQWLQESKIANDLGVSRSPVREALQQLLGDGLAVNIPNKGVFVKQITEKDMLDIFQVRMCFETLGIQHSQENMTDEIRQQLIDLKTKLNHFYQAQDKQNYIREDSRLHQLIIQLTGNKLIQDVSVRIYTMEHLSRTISLYDTERFNESLAEHIGTIDGILQGDISLALEYNNRHLILAREESVKQIQASVRQGEKSETNQRL